jgi:adenylosuccinate synthase
MNVVLDSFWGSSGKGKVSTYLADKFGVTNVSSSNYPNAGHTASFKDGTSFVAKAIPTAVILKKVKGVGVAGFISPGSGFDPAQLVKEWDQCGRPNLFVHSRASLVPPEQVQREREGADSTKHLASTMQGSGTAISDKVLRREGVALAGTKPFSEYLRFLHATSPKSAEILSNGGLEEAAEKIRVIDAMEFRNLFHSMLGAGETWLHEGSQGYALSIDHGSHYPFCTSRNCTVQAAMDHMAAPPSSVGDVYLNLRTHPIRVGNVVEDGVQKGYSGDFYPDCRELTWDQVAAESGMPKEEADKLAERERTTVTKRIRRVSTFSWIGLKDAVRVNGVTRLTLNFVQYLNWKDKGVRGGREAYAQLSQETRSFVERLEAETGLPVVLIGTGADHDEIVDLLP